MQLRRKAYECTKSMYIPNTLYGFVAKNGIKGEKPTSTRSLA